MFKWIAAPKDHTKLLHDILDRIEEDTAQWLFDQPLFQQWQKEPAWSRDGNPFDGHRLIWVHGMTNHRLLQFVECED